MADREAMCRAFRVHGDQAQLYCIRHGGIETPDQMLELSERCMALQPRDESPSPLSLGKFYRFLARNADFIFEPPGDSPLELSDKFVDGTEGIFPDAPPMEMSYLDRRRWFLLSLMPYDALIGRVIRMDDDGIFMNLLCFANAKHQKIDDIEYTAKVKCNDKVEIGSLVKGALIGSDWRQRMIILTTDLNDLPEQYRALKPKLGPISERELPTWYKLMKKNEIEKKPFSFFLENCEPMSAQRMLEYFASRSGENNFFEFYMGKHIPKELRASQIEARHRLELSKMHFQKGMKSLSCHVPVDAIKSFEECLKYGPENIDALMWCGVANTNIGRYKEAAELYSKCLMLDSNNEKVKQFLKRSLMKIIKKCEDEGNYVECFIFLKKLYEIGEIPNLRSHWKILKKILAYNMSKPRLVFMKAFHLTSDDASASVDMDVEYLDRSKRGVTKPNPSVIPPLPTSPPLPAPPPALIGPIYPIMYAQVPYQHAATLQSWEKLPPSSSKEDVHHKSRRSHYHRRHKHRNKHRKSTNKSRAKRRGSNSSSSSKPEARSHHKEPSELASSTKVKSLLHMKRRRRRSESLERYLDQRRRSASRERRRNSPSALSSRQTSRCSQSSSAERFRSLASAQRDSVERVRSRSESYKSISPSSDSFDSCSRLVRMRRSPSPKHRKPSNPAEMLKDGSLDKPSLPGAVSPNKQRALFQPVSRVPPYVSSTRVPAVKIMQNVIKKSFG